MSKVIQVEHPLTGAFLNQRFVHRLGREDRLSSSKDLSNK